MLHMKEAIVDKVAKLHPYDESNLSGKILTTYKKTKDSWASQVTSTTAILANTKQEGKIANAKPVTRSMHLAINFN